MGFGVCWDPASLSLCGNREAYKAGSRRNYYYYYLFLPPLPDYAWGWVRKVCRRRAGWDALSKPRSPRGRVDSHPQPWLQKTFNFPMEPITLNKHCWFEVVSETFLFPVSHSPPSKYPHKCQGTGNVDQYRNYWLAPNLSYSQFNAYGAHMTKNSEDYVITMWCPVANLTLHHLRALEFRSSEWASIFGSAASPPWCLVIYKVVKPHLSNRASGGLSENKNEGSLSKSNVM